MKFMTQSFLVILVLAATIGAAIVHGQKSYRWGTNEKLIALTKVVNEFPAEVGEWRQINELELNYTTQSLLNCFASFVRIYENSQTGETYQVALLLGPTGPLSVHTPDVCYNSVEFQVYEPRTKISSTDETDQFWSIYFQSRDVDGEFLQSVYAWLDEDDWKAPDSSRTGFAGKPYLFKLQIAAGNDDWTKIENNDSIKTFLDEFTTLFDERLDKFTVQ